MRIDPWFLTCLRRSLLCCALLMASASGSGCAESGTQSTEDNVGSDGGDAQPHVDASSVGALPDASSDSDGSEPAATPGDAVAAIHDAGQRPPPTALGSDAGKSDAGDSDAGEGHAGHGDAGESDAKVALLDASTPGPSTPTLDASPAPGPAPDAAAAPDADAATDTPPTPAPTSGGHIRGDAPTQASASSRGPLAVSSYANSAGDDFFSGTIYYPTEGEAPFSIVAVVPGFVSPEFTIQGWGSFLASHGMITMTLATNFLTDLPQDRADALWDALAVLKAEGKRTGSPIQGKVDESRMATIGWSMGGGGTLLVAEQHPEIKATISLCGWSPLASYSRLRVPALLFAGTIDVLAGGQSQGFYNSIPATTPKMLYEVNAGHGFANDPSGESGAVGRYGLSWMKVFLEGDERYRQFLTVKGPGTTDWRTTVR